MRGLSEDSNELKALRNNMEEMHKIYKDQCQRLDDIKKVSKG